MAKTPAIMSISTLVTRRPSGNSKDMNRHHNPIFCTCHRRAFLGGLTISAGFPLGGGSASAHDRLLPDTPAARASAVYLETLSSPTMVRHCKRTYRFGLALAEKAGAKPDLEALYIGCLLHDLGLEPRFAGPEDFETIGAREAHRFLAKRGDDRLADMVSAAIEIHTSITTADDPRPEVAYLHMGAMVDVTGARFDQIEPRLIQQIVAEYPRDGTKAMLSALLKHQIDTKPGSRIGLVGARVDVPKAVQDAPFAD